MSIWQGPGCSAVMESPCTILAPPPFWCLTGSCFPKLAPLKCSECKPSFSFSPFPAPPFQMCSFPSPYPPSKNTMHAKPLQSRLTLCDLWTVAHQAPLSMGFSRQEYCSGLPCPPPGDLPHPGIKPESLLSPALAGGFFTISANWDAPMNTITNL